MPKQPFLDQHTRAAQKVSARLEAQLAASEAELEVLKAKIADLEEKLAKGLVKKGTKKSKESSDNE